MFGILGVEVTLVDKQTRPLEFLDGEIVDELIHQMRNHQVTFRLGEKVESLERLKKATSLEPSFIWPRANDWSRRPSYIPWGVPAQLMP